MKTKALRLFCALGALCVMTATAQTAPGILSSVQVPGLNQPFTVNGQTFVLATNEQGALVAFTSGPAGTNSVTPPRTTSEALSKVQQMVNDNNPANASFYGTNEYVLSVGGVYAQNSGQGAAMLSIEKYGVLKSLPNIGAGASVLQGTANGQNGTAGAFAFVDYRRPIGDTAFIVGAGGGYDNYNKSPMGVLKFEVEHRQNAHLGEYVGAGYAFEGLKNDRGLMIGGGIRYAF